MKKIFGQTGFSFNSANTLRCFFSLLLLLPTAVSHGATLKAEYRFNNSLTSGIAGAPDLVSIDPLSANHFNSDAVNGQTQPVFTWSGIALPTNAEAGLMLNTTGLINGTNYSVQMIFMFTDHANGWRRIIDVSNRQLDSGFYVDSGNHVRVYPTNPGLITPFTNNVYEDVILTVGNGMEAAYLNGILQFSNSTAIMEITSTVNPMIFFVDNAGSGMGDFSNGSIALLRLYDGVIVPGIPALTIRSTVTNSVVLSWPSPSTGYVLQQNTNLAATNWNVSALMPSDNGTIKSVIVVPPTGNKFFRLYHP